MPHLKVQTNRPVSRAVETMIVNEITALLLRETDRPRDSVVITIESDKRLSLAATDEPVAFVELNSSHLPPPGPALGEALVNVVHRHLEIPAARVFVKFISTTPGTQHRAA